MTRCIFCGYCEVACPFDAITMGHDYELSDYNRSDLIFTKEMLLGGPGGAHAAAARGRVGLAVGSATSVFWSSPRSAGARRGARSRAPAQSVLQRARRWSCT